MMSYREVFFTAVMVCGLATLLFGTNPHVQAPLEAEAPAAQTVSVEPSQGLEGQAEYSIRKATLVALLDAGINDFATGNLEGKQDGTIVAVSCLA